MSLQADRPARERRCWWLAALVALAVGGCGGTSDALNGAARASGATTQLSRQLMRSWCPQAVAAGGRRLTEAQARDACIGRGMRGCASCAATGTTRVRR
jgi:hypothetical protein